MNDEYRLISIRRKLKDLLMARRLSEDPERTGVVELADFGKRCERLAEYAAETKEEFGGRVHVIADELELAARLAAKLETLPRGGTRFQTQTGLLEEVARMLDAEDEPPVQLSLSVLAGRKRRSSRASSSLTA